ncbi:TlpA family protein disulfide reductase [Streptomyces sp. O3]
MSSSHVSRPRRRALRLPVALLVGAAFALTACSSDVSGSGGNTNFVTGSGGIATVAKGERHAAPDIGGETVDGGEVRLSDYKGKIVVVNVWGSWCAPCRVEAPHFVEVAGDLKDQGVEFLGINTRDLDVKNARAFEKDFKVTYPSLYDPKGKSILKFNGDLALKSIPSTLVVDREGKVAARAPKPLSEDDLRSMIKPVLAEK